MISLTWSKKCTDMDGNVFWWLNGLDFLADNGYELCRIDEKAKGYYVSLMVNEDDDGLRHKQYQKPFATLEEAMKYAEETLMYGGDYK